MDDLERPYTDCSSGRRRLLEAVDGLKCSRLLEQSCVRQRMNGYSSSCRRGFKQSKFSKNRLPSNVLPDPCTKPETPCPALTLATTQPMQLRPVRNFTIIIMFLLGSTLCDRLQLKTIIPSIRPGTPSWAYYYLAKNKQKVKRLIKPNRVIDIEIYFSSEETSTSSNSRPNYSAPPRPEIGRIRRLLPSIPGVTPRYLPHHQVRPAVANLPSPSRLSTRETRQPEPAIRRVLPVPVKTSHDPYWCVRRAMTPQPVVSHPQYLAVPPRCIPESREAAHRTHCHLIPLLPPSRLLPTPIRTIPRLDRQGAAEVLAPLIVSQAQNEDHLHVPRPDLVYLENKYKHIRLASTKVTASITPRSQLFGTGSHSRQPPAENLPSTSSTPSTVRCEYPLDERDTQSTWTSQQKPYGKTDEESDITLPLLKNTTEGEKNLLEFFGAREVLSPPSLQLTKMDSLPVPSICTMRLAQSESFHYEQIESFQETDNKEDQESVIASKSCSYEELKADSFIATTNSAAFSCLGDEQLPIRFAIPVRPRSLPRRILASCVRAFETCFTR
ncbi:hypothetical protein SFRURICE_010437, partial [Spodoptera frugiperda]